MEDKHTYEINERIQLILDSAPLGVTIYDASQKLVDCNTVAVKMFGNASKEEFIRETNKDFYLQFPPHQPCGTATKDKIEWLFETATEYRSVQLELDHLTVQGDKLPTDLTVVRVDQQDTYIFVAYIRDLREERRAKESEQEALEFGNMLYELSPVQMFLWDENLKLIDVNDRTLSFFGVSSRDEFFQHIESLYPQYQPCGTPTREFYTAHLKKALSEGYDRFELLCNDLNGAELPVEATYIRSTRLGNTIVIGYNYDLRHTKLAEKQRLELAEESSRAKSKFLARMSHEIRTPITAVLGISEIELQNPDLSPRLSESFAKIHNSADVLLEIVNGILDFSKIEAGKMEMMEDEYETASMISNVAQLHVAYLSSKTINFHVQVDENLPSALVGDSLRIEQILNNLLSNAFKYTETGSITLSVKWDDGNLVLSVTDTGIGMTQGQLDVLYDDYTRFHEHELHHVSGTGLGMSIVYSLVHMMNAHIELKSKVGVGTEITVRIPQKTVNSNVIGKDLAESLQTFEIITSKAAKSFKIDPDPMPYGKVLVVDDMDANLYVAKGLLTFYELNIDTCTSGYEAVEKVKRGNVYDVIFLDHMMPGMNGVQALKAIRDLGYTSPIVALTANALIGQAEEFINAGFDGFISKPIQTARLNSILVKFIKDKQTPEVIEAANAAKKKSPNRGSIEKYQHDSELVAKLRLDYARHNKNIVTEILHAIDAGDISTAYLKAHSLKGVAGLIHEQKLVEIASQVEYLLKEEKLPINDLLAKLEKEHQHVLESISTPEPTKNAEALDKEKTKKLLDQLTPLLEDCNTNCLKLLDELKVIPEAAILVGFIEAFEFEMALKSIKMLREILDT